MTLLNSFSSGSTRPTAQVLPVQNEAGSSPSTHHPVPIQMMTAGSPHITPMRILNSLHKPERGATDMKLLSSSMHSLLSVEDRTKYSPGLPRGSVKMEKSFGNTIMEGMPASHQPLQVLSGVPENSSSAPSVNFGPRTKMVHASNLDRMVKTAAQPGILVESSTSAAAPASPVFHMARPPIKLLVSSSIPADSTLAGPSSGSNNMQFSMSPAIISPRTALYTANTKVAFSAMSSMPVAPVPSSSFCANGSTASSNSHPPTPFANLSNVPTGPAPSSSPTLSPAAENSFYNSSSSSSGGGSSAGSIPVPNQNHHHHSPHQQPPLPPPPGCLVCSSCGCSGNCGSSGMTVSYANYFQHPFSGPSMFTFPFLPFNPLCSNGYLNTQHYNGSSAFPMVPSPYNNGIGTDSVMSGQSTFAMPPMQSFMAGTAGVYQAPSMMGSSGGGTGHKKNGNLSCYNCGASGHRAQDCKQPPMDFNRQGEEPVGLQ